MQIAETSPDQAKYILRVMKVAATGEGHLASTPRALITAIQKYLLLTEYDIAHLEFISPEEVAIAITEPIMRQQLLQATIVVILSAGEARLPQLHIIESYAKALEVSEDILKHLRMLCRRQILRLKIDVYRHCFIGQKYKQEVDKQGIGWLLKGLISYTGIKEDSRLASSYRKLEFLPQESLGYQLWKFHQENKYPFPGEKGGAHENTSYHDITHILAGYDSSPLGELQTVAMTVGYKKTGDPLASIFFILLQQHLGINVGFLSQARRGVLDLPDAPDKFIRAFLRGTAMNIDLSDNWDSWDVISCPVEELRKQYNIV